MCASRYLMCCNAAGMCAQGSVPRFRAFSRVKLWGDPRSFMSLPSHAPQLISPRSTPPARPYLLSTACAIYYHRRSFAAQEPQNRSDQRPHRLAHFTAIHCARPASQTTASRKSSDAHQSADLIIKGEVERNGNESQAARGPKPTVRGSEFTNV